LSSGSLKPDCLPDMTRLEIVSVFKTVFALMALEPNSKFRPANQDISMNITDGNIEAILDVHKARCVAPHGAACWLRGNGARYSGVLKESANGGWALSTADPSMLPGLVSAKRLDLELHVDRALSSQLSLPKFQVFEFHLDLEARQVHFQ